ncbi:MAG: hypothetical protein JWM40_2961 [Frankiales bacterium]|nr:hypothetical protein [Frankiales bacterium]
MTSTSTPTTWSGGVNARSLLSIAKDPHDGPCTGPRGTCLPAPDTTPMEARP